MGGGTLMCYLTFILYMALDKTATEDVDSQDEDQLRTEFLTGRELREVYAPSPAGFDITHYDWFNGEKNRYADDWGEEATDVEPRPVRLGDNL